MEEFIIVFRESLEAVLVVSIVIGYLVKIKKLKLLRFVYLGVFLALLGSVAGAIGFYQLFGNFTGTAEQIFEGITMLFSSVLIFYLIVWMANKKNQASLALKTQIQNISSSNEKFGIMFLVFMSILREGIETILFLNASISSQNGFSLIYASFGIIAGIAVGYGAYLGFRGLNLKYLFNISSALLALFAVGLFTRGIHEFQEAQILPVYIEHIWDISYILDENSFAGGVIKSMFGYNANPSLMEVLVYCGSIFFLFIFYSKKQMVSKKI